MIALLLIALILATAAAAWLYRQRLVRYLPTKNTMLTITIITSIVVLAVLAVLPDLIILLSAVKLLSPLVKTALVLAAVVSLIVVGCSKHNAEPTKPHSIEWRGPATGYEDTTQADRPE